MALADMPRIWGICCKIGLFTYEAVVMAVTFYIYHKSRAYADVWVRNAPSLRKAN